VKKNPWERVVTGDGFTPLLFYLMVGISVVLAGMFLQFWLSFAPLWLGR
jgi:hypothetical protein